ncbi:stage II sporulation protein M [Promicromonospora sp. NPDC050249]|uniref:stage II sporulation protein M n=1 Tax=Promicromonospora sp. NPDC050249 TaxID=3154743 RepID=UPI0033EDFFBD
MRLFRRALQTIQANRRAYLALNAILYGSVLVGFGAGLLFPGLAAAQRESFEDGGQADLVRSLLDSPWLFALAILANNALRAGLLNIVLPSMLVPFAGVVWYVYSLFTVGLMLAPVDRDGWLVLIPHSLTVVMEIQAYVLLALGAYLLGRAWIWPRTVDAENRRQAYARGLRQLGVLSLPALALLVVFALYESFSIVYLVPLLTAG